MRRQLCWILAGIVTGWAAGTLADSGQAVQMTGTNKAAAPVPRGGNRLEDLKPSAADWGTERHDLFPNMKYGPQICDWGPNGNTSPAFWPEKVKICSRAPDKVPWPEGQSYGSTRTDCFVVGGEFMTGVGLWARRMTFYHWLDYAVPRGANRFTAKLYVTDDARGYVWWGGPKINQQFTFETLIDGRQAARVERTRLALEQGSGELIQDLNVSIPAGAKTIRFRLINSAWGDGNANTELVIHDGAFIQEKS